MRIEIGALAAVVLLGAAGRAGEISAVDKKGLGKAVRRYVQSESAEQGVFVVHDAKLDKDWSLKLIAVRPETMVQMDQKLYKVCGDFRQLRGAKRLGLDFLVNRTDTGWAVRDVIVQNVGQGCAGAGAGKGPVAATYACPMDGYVSDKPGKCPRCGMELQKK